MANQKTYTIEIAGVKESYESVSKLADVLDKLSDRTVKTGAEIKAQTEVVSRNTKATDELGKATKKLQEFDAEYEKEVQRVKQELSAQKKEVSELIKQEQAKAVVDEKQLTSYADKQRYLTSLNKLIRTHANVTDEDKQQIRAMVEESARLQSELKAFDEEMKIYSRNVGNYSESAQMVVDSNKSMKQEIRELKNEMAEMLVNGVDKTDPKFQALAKRAGELKDAMDDAGDEITHFASDTRSLDNVINLAQTATSAWGLYSNAMQAFGVENAEAEESIKRMMAVMSTLQSLQTLQNALTAQGSATMKIYETVVGGVSKMLGLKTAATAADTVATNASTVATKALSIAMRAIPLMFVIGLIVTLVTHWQSVVGWFRKTFPVLDRLSGKLKQFGGLINTVKAALMGFGKAILNWVVNPIKTMANVISKVLSGDFSGAMAAVTQGIRNQFKGTADAFNKVFKKQVNKGLEEITYKSVQEGNKRTKQELEELKIRERNNKTYSKKYIELQKKDFAERKKLAKNNQEELNKIKLEEMQFYADIEDRKTQYSKQQQQSRTGNEKAYARQRKKNAADNAKDEQERLKKSEELIRNAENNIREANALIKTSNEETNRQLIKLFDDSYNEYVKHYADIRTTYYEDAGIRKNLEEYALKNTEEYLVERKALVVQALLEEAAAMKDSYQKTIDNTKQLIADTQKLLETATGDMTIKLKMQLNQLQTTLEDITKEMKNNLGEYADTDNPINIEFDFDANKVAGKIKELNAKATEEGRKLGFTLIDVFQTVLNTNTLVFDKMGDAVEYLEKGSKNAFNDVRKNLTEVAEAAMLPSESIQKINDAFDDLSEKFGTMSETDFRKYWVKTAEDISRVFAGTNTNVSKLGQLVNKITDEINGMSRKLKEDIYKELMNQTEKVFSYNEKVLRRFQEAAKGLKLEIVNVDDAFTNTFGGQIMSIDKTRERYDKLRTAYQEYLKQLQANRNEDLWKNRFEYTAKLHGQESIEYKLLIDEKKKADAEYLIEYEKVQQQLREIDKKTNDIQADYAESLGNRIKEIYKAFSENMFEPLAEGFTALLDYQIEEAEKRLEKVEKLLDKAVDLREESEEKIEEINNKLRDSDKGNTEALKQQLADEMSLLVQRQQNERDLNKQKEREEALIQKKQRQQRKIELSQKLIEGIVNGAVGVTAALKYGFPLGPIFAAIIGSMAALQTGIIVKQISKLEKGGKLKGKSHAQGGMRVEGTNIELEGNEFVINKKSTAKYEPLIEAINNDDPMRVRSLANKYEHGGRIGGTTINNYYNSSSHLVSNSINKYAQGGKLNYGQSVAAIEQNSVAARISDTLSQIDFSPVVSVRDIVRKTNDVAKVVDLAGGNLKR